MKQVTFIVECVMTDVQPTIIVRDPRSGQVVKVAKSIDELGSFFSSVCDSLKTENSVSHE